MKILQINSVCGIRSTGRIATDLATEFESQGHECKIAYGRETVPEKFQKYAVRIGTDVDVKKNALAARLFDNEGFNAKKATKEFIKWADEYNPDLLWLHNLHGYYINIEILFDWIKSRPNMQVKWLLHDCWTFTGHCTHFVTAKCEQWKTHCFSCSKTRSYPKSFIISKCRNNFERKKNLFCGVNNMTIITPSKWLADLVKCSFLKVYPVEVRHNTIDTEIFKPTLSDFKMKRGLENKKIVLGVASAWGKNKGLYDFIELSNMLDDTYKVVLVGLTKEQIKKIPSQIVCIERTNSPQELAEIYTAAEVFLNLTYQDNYPTVNLESQACGTPCITYRTGGSIESVPENNIIEQGDLAGVVDMILNRRYSLS